MKLPEQYLINGQFDKAISLYEKRIENNPNLKVNYWYLGIALLLNKQEDEAQAIWFSALSEDGENDVDLSIQELVNILKTLGNNYFKQRKFSLVIYIYEQIIELETDNPNNYYKLGNAWAQLGNDEQAIKYWQITTELQQDYLKAYQKQGQFYQQIGEYKAAINCYEKMLSYEQQNKDIIYNLAFCFAKIGDLQTSLAYDKLALKKDPDFSLVLGDLSYLSIKIGEIENAINYLKTLSKNLEIYQLNYLNFLKKSPNNEHSLIKKIMENITAKELDQNEITRLLAQLFLSKNNWQLALNCCNYLIKKNPQILDNYYYLSVALVGLNKPEEVLKISDLIKPKNQEISEKILNLVTQPNPNQITLNNRELIPLGYYETTEKWYQETKLKDSEYYSIYPEEIINLTPPKSLDDEINFSFRFGETMKLPGSFVTTIPDGKYWLNRDESSSAVITKDNKILGDISAEFPVLSPGHPDQHPRKHSIFKRLNLPPLEKFEQTIVIISGLLNNIYFHWMFDVLPRFQLLKLSGINLETIDYFYIHNQLPFQRESLSILGIPESKIINPVEYPHIQAKKLIIPSYPSTVAWMPKWTVNFLRETFLNKEINVIENKGIDKIYLTRKNALNRNIINENEVENLLTKHGFISVSLETKSVKEQADLFSQAKVIVAAHGSGLSNLVFCSPNTKVIEIFSQRYVYHCYWLLSNLLDLDYYYLSGEIPEGYLLHHAIYPDSRLEDIYVNLNKLDQLL